MSLSHTYICSEGHTLTSTYPLHACPTHPEGTLLHSGTIARLDNGNLKVSGRKRGVPPDPALISRNQEITEKYKTGQYTMEQLGQEYGGLTRERVRQIINMVDPEWLKGAQARRDERDQKRYEEMIAQRVAAKAGLVCLACWVPLGVVIATKQDLRVRRFCSKKCRDMFTSCRYHLDDQRRKSAQKCMAAWCLKSGRGSKVWATKILNGEEAKIKGRWTTTAATNATREYFKIMRILRAENVAKYGMPANPPYPIPDHIFAREAKLEEFS